MRTLYPILLVTFLYSTANFMFAILFPYYLRELHWGHAWIGALIGGSVVLTMIFRVLSGSFLDHYPIKRILNVSYLAFLLIFIFYLGKNPVVVVISRLLQGALLGILSNALAAYILQCLSRENRREGLSLYTFASIAPSCFGPSLTLWLREEIGLSQVLSLIFLIVLFTLFLLLAIPANPEDRLRPLFRLHHFGQRGRVSSRERSGVPLWHHGCFLPCCAILTLLYVTSGTFVTYLPAYLDGLFPQMSKYFFLIQTLVLSSSRFFTKYLKMDERDLPGHLLAPLLFGHALGTASMAYFPSSLSFISAAVLTGITMGMMYPLLLNFVTFQIPENRKSEGVGILTAATDLGSAMGNIMLGPLAESASLKAVFIASSFCSLMTFWPFRLLKRHQDRQETLEMQEVAEIPQDMVVLTERPPSSPPLERTL